MSALSAGKAKAEFQFLSTSLLKEIQEGYYQEVDQATSDEEEKLPRARIQVIEGIINRRRKGHESKRQPCPEYD